jgi:hypothetical protein
VDPDDQIIVRLHPESRAALSRLVERGGSVSTDQTVADALALADFIYEAAQAETEVLLLTHAGETYRVLLPYLRNRSSR